MTGAPRDWPMTTAPPGASLRAGDPTRPRTLVMTDRITKYFPVRQGLLGGVKRFSRAVDGVTLR
ncbi:MAG TPA: hypothetical protein VE987_12320, partial [Polyangiaceae bacterium]|nr:hypothetical protein [Polyangiaceae bacterium]